MNKKGEGVEVHAITHITIRAYSSKMFIIILCHSVFKGEPLLGVAYYLPRKSRLLPHFQYQLTFVNALILSN